MLITLLGQYISIQKTSTDSPLVILEVDLVVSDYDGIALPAPTSCFPTNEQFAIIQYDNWFECQVEGYCWDFSMATPACIRSKSCKSYIYPNKGAMGSCFVKCTYFSIIGYTSIVKLQIKSLL